ncbi:sensor histidine kinase [Kordia sp.]|uniref:sensor histidine kinase n=1 Tax=Kordia sp. TaxID=1965332 RepID=UPI003D29B270
MNRGNRVLIQVLFWAIVLFVIALSQVDAVRFLGENWLAFIFQAVLIISVVYLLADKLLFKKKYAWFVLISIVLVVVFTIIASMLPAAAGPPRLEMIDRPRKSPTPFLINFLLLSLTFVVAAVIEIFLFAKRKEEALILSKTETLETELKFLKAQINPHFLFNSLNNIYALCAIDTTKTQKSITYLSDMLRYVLYECEQKTVLIQKEVTYIENYINLFKLKSSKEYSIKTHFSIENHDLKIAPMLFIPFVENAFKHGNIEQIHENYIHISIVSSGSETIFTIENTKPNIPTEKDAVGGIGIKNVAKRLEILYPEKHLLAIQNTNTIFKVELKLETNA